MHARLTIRTRLIAVLFAASAFLVQASDKPAPASPDESDYRTVPVSVGGKQVPVRVLDTNPYAHIKEGAPTTDEKGKFHPENFSFSTTSSLANKSFSTAESSLVKSDSDFTDPTRNKFATSSFSDHALSTSPAEFSSKAHATSASAYEKSVAGLDKTYVTAANTEGDLNRSALLPQPDLADFENRSANLGGKDLAAYSKDSEMAHKQYLGPGAQNVPNGVTIHDNVVISRMSGIPNRDLTIDEVRNLINHGTKPHTDEKPDEPSKALNDPDYKPQPLRDNPNPANSADDKDDPVPAPGVMATQPAPAPESSEPLPQH